MKRYGSIWMLAALHQVVHVLGLVESFCLDVAGKGNQFACKKLLRDDTCVIFYVRCV